jgi:hypothetical protein
MASVHEQSGVRADGGGGASDIAVGNPGDRPRKFVTEL